MFHKKKYSYVIFIDIDTTLSVDPCNPSPCGSNAVCNKGECSCAPEYHGDPYFGCRPECVYNTDCPSDKACMKNKCQNPCLNTCGINAKCDVLNHVPMCTCPKGMSGNAFIECRRVQGKLHFFVVYNKIVIANLNLAIF